MVLFYKSFIESLLTLCLISWSGNLSMCNKNSLSSIMKTASKKIDTQQLSSSDIWNRQIVRKARSILASCDHLLLEDLIFSLPVGGTGYLGQSAMGTNFPFFQVELMHLTGFNP